MEKVVRVYKQGKDGEKRLWFNDAHGSSRDIAEEIVDGGYRVIHWDDIQVIVEG